VGFDPAIGSEIRKTRPALVLQNDVGNRWRSTTIVAAITSRTTGERYLTEVDVSAPEGGLDRDSRVLLGQLRTVDRLRLLRRLGRLTPGTQARVDDALRVSLGLVRL
jgi:mRNA interferase MazF